MANHGKCKKCWWYLMIQGRKYPFVDGHIKEIPGKGKCYMWNDNEHHYQIVQDDSYCPDYINRGIEFRRSGSLEDWIKNNNID